MKTVFLGVLVFLPLSAGAQSPASHQSRDLADLSLEELMNEPVTSVSKREQKRGDVATAISVLSNEELRRSGVTSVAEALRLVPGLDVGSVNAREYAISARGFNEVFAKTILVLVDGRAVYSPLFAGVYWDLQQTMLEDVDRIEVIRGPGGTIWGANAVNGVINIVTRSAAATQGGLAYAGAGNVNETLAGVRYGGRRGEDTWYRIFGSYRSMGDFPLSDGASADDAWHGWQGGLRVDRHLGSTTRLTWQADATSTHFDMGAYDGYNVNTLGRWERDLADRSTVRLQAYYDRLHRDEISRIRSTADTFDVEFQHTLGLGARHDLIWGMGYRFIDNAIGQTAITVQEGDFSQQLFSVFVQDEWRLMPDKLTLTAGMKVEHNDFTGVEIQPGLRAVFKPTTDQTLWAAISRAVRTPSQLEGRSVLAVAIDGPTPGPGGELFVPTIVGNTALDAEILRGYEVGYRIQPTARVSMELAGFYNEYRDLINFGGVTDFVPGTPFGVAEIPWLNLMNGETYGGEVQLSFVPTDVWRLYLNYSLLFMQMHSPDSAGAEGLEGSSPRQQSTLRSSYDLNEHLLLDAQLRYVDAILSVPSYLAADLRLAWRPTKQLELSLTGQNLLDRRHPEQGFAAFAVTAEVPRGVYGRILWRY